MLLASAEFPFFLRHRVDLFCLVWFCFLCLSCADGAQTGSETHFGDTGKALLVCDPAQSMCGDNSACVCRLCTTSCESADECRRPFEEELGQSLIEDVAENFACLPPACLSDENEPEKVCEVRCQTPDDCSFLENTTERDFTCVSGFCREGSDADELTNQLASGTSLSCSIAEGGLLTCSGDNQYGGLGNGEVAPMQGQFSPLSDVVQVGVGDQHVCTLTRDSKVMCWGGNAFGQTGQPAETPQVTSPSEVGLPDAGVKALHVGSFTSCIVTDDEVLWCWGRTTGISPTTTQEAPTRISPEGSRVIGVALGSNHGCMRLEREGDTSVECWGDNFSGQVGQEPASDSLPPTPVDGLPLLPRGVSGEGSLAASDTASCALSVDGEVFCWGGNFRGQLGAGDEELMESHQPVRVEGLPTQAVRIFAGWHHYCALLADRSLACWGAQADIVTIDWSARVVAEEVVAVALGNGVSLIETAEGERLSWGPSPDDLLRSSADFGVPTPCCADF